MSGPHPGIMLGAELLDGLGGSGLGRLEVGQQAAQEIGGRLARLVQGQQAEPRHHKTRGPQPKQESAPG